jgi:hypothetical protein
LLGNGDKLSEKVYGEEKRGKNIFYLANHRVDKEGQKSLVPARRAQPTNQVKTPYKMYVLL